MAFRDLAALVDNHVVLANATRPLPRLQQLSSVENSAQDAPARQEFLDNGKCIKQCRDHGLLFIAQVGKAGRVVIVTEKVETERQIALEREPHDVWQAACVAASDGDGEMRSMSLSDQLGDRALDEMKRWPAVREGPLGIVLAAHSV